MRRHKRPLWLLLLSFLSFGALIYLLLSFPPTYGFTIYDLRFTILPIFFVLLFIFVYVFSTFVFANKRRGLLIALFVVIYLLLRINNLIHPFFAILLLILFGSIELFFLKRK